MSFKDRPYCASTNCNNECGRRMPLEDKDELKELAFNKHSAIVSYGYFYGKELFSRLKGLGNDDKECLNNTLE